VQQRTLGRDGSLNELEPAGAASRETGGAAGASGGAAKRQALPEVTPKTMLSLPAYLGTLFEFACICYSSRKLYRVTTFDVRVAFLYALHSKGNSSLGIRGDADMHARSGVAADGDPRAWDTGGLTACFNAVFKRAVDAKKALSDAVSRCATWDDVSEQAHSWASGLERNPAGDAIPQEVWLETTEQAIECYAAVLVSIMTLAKRPVLFAWSSGLEEAVWQTLGQVLYTRPAYSELHASVYKLILEPEPGDDMLIKTLFAVPLLFDIGALISDGKTRLCVFDVADRAFGGSLAMDVVCGAQRVALSADCAIKKHMKTKRGQEAVRRALNLAEDVEYNTDTLFDGYRAWLCTQPGGLDVDPYLRTLMPAMARRWYAHVAGYDVMRNMAIEVFTDVLRLVVLDRLPVGVSAGQAVISRLRIEMLLYNYPTVDADTQGLRWKVVSFDD